MPMSRKYIARGAAVIAIAMILFPPINVEKRLAFNSVDESMNRTLVQITTAEFIGWQFIGQNDIHLKGKPVWAPKDPDNLTLMERLTAPGMSTPEESEIGHKRINFQIWGWELLVLGLLSGLALRHLKKSPPA